MPIRYEIDEQVGLILETWTGNITGDALLAYWHRYMQDPAVMALRRTLVDLRGANIQFTGNDLSVMVKHYVVPLLQGRDWVTAIVASRPDQVGVSHQYHVFAEVFSKDAIFHDMDAARAWVLQQLHKS